ncbi:hypothetical protein [Devosia sp. A16]|uniref:hypothetical protein n=1 Tax=Devosia sp. A16 TaxID=1736675 RepID=UPI0006D76AFE|nr:hypothetical protein [Devosia sp. A16]
MATYFVVQAWQMGNRGVLIADEPMEAPSEAAALSRARVLAGARAGVIAFCRNGDPATGEWNDAVVLCEHGVVPRDLMELAG